MERNIGTGNGMWGVQRKRGMLTRIPGNLLKDFGECYHFNILRNYQEDFGNVPEDSGECY